MENNVYSSDLAYSLQQKYDQEERERNDLALELEELILTRTHDISAFDGNRYQAIFNILGAYATQQVEIRVAQWYD